MNEFGILGSYVLYFCGMIFLVSSFAVGPIADHTLEKLAITSSFFLAAIATKVVFCISGRRESEG